MPQLASQTPHDAAIQAIRRTNMKVGNDILRLFKSHIDFIYTPASPARVLREYINRYLPSNQVLKRYVWTLTRTPGVDNIGETLWAAHYSRYSRAVTILEKMRSYFEPDPDSFNPLSDAFWEPLFEMIRVGSALNYSGRWQYMTTSTSLHPDIVNARNEFISANPRRFGVNLDSRFLEPVYVTPSAEQIRALPTCEQVSDPETESDNCPICLSDYSEDSMSMVLPCSHYMHQTCALSHFETSVKCPICRKDIREKNKSEF